MGIPNFVAPRGEKLDLPHFKHDLPKYALSNVTSEALQWWDSFVEQIEQSMESSVSTKDTTWPFQEIVEVTRENYSLQEVQQNEPANIRLLQLRNAETDTIPEVMVHVTA